MYTRGSRPIPALEIGMTPHIVSVLLLLLSAALTIKAFLASTDRLPGHLFEPRTVWSGWAQVGYFVTLISTGFWTV